MKNPYPINPFLKIFINIWMFFFTRKHNISAEISEEIKHLNEPYLLLSNHCGDYDPFIISYFLKNKLPNYVASDAVLRDKMGYLLKGLGAMPKKKGVKDTAIIREMNKVIQAGGAIGLFPEGARTWTGETLFIDASLAKLVRLLNVPVIAVTMRGAYAMDPRWGSHKRKTDKVVISFEKLYDKGEARKIDDGDIMRTIGRKLYYNHVDVQREEKIKIHSEKRAEYLDFILYSCPKCETFSSFKSNGNHATCTHCKQAIFVDEFGFLQGTDNYNLPFDNVRDWVNWENEKFARWIHQELQTEQIEKPLFSTPKMKVLHSKGMGTMKPYSTGTLDFFTHGIQLNLEKETLFFPFEQVDTLSPQFQERLELMIGDRAFRLIGIDQKAAGIKWELAMSLVFTMKGQTQKVSPYYAKLVNQVLRVND